MLKTKRRRLVVFTVIVAMFVSAASFGAFGADLESENIKSVQGTVTELTPYFDTKGEAVADNYFLFMKIGENEDGSDNLVSFQITEKTDSLNSFKLGIGAEVKAYYDGSLPVIMIYPPRYVAVAVEVLSEGAEQGTEQDAETNEAAVPVEPPEEAAPPESGLHVNGEAVDAPMYNENGVVMAPLRAVSESLGYEVRWNGETKTVEVGNFVSLTIGKDEYNLARRAPISLGAPPVIKDGSTFVPVDFFSHLLGCETEVAVTGDDIAVRIDRIETDLKLAE